MNMRAVGDVSADDLALVAAQLGRAPRGMVAVAARGADGAPLVTTTAPRLPDGTPFPTMYYLTDPALTAAVSRLEADGLMRELNERLANDAEFAAEYKAAHASYLRERDALARSLSLEVPEIAGISAGGMQTRVKCLHALVAHSLASGPGANPVGDIVLGILEPTTIGSSRRE